MDLSVIIPARNEEWLAKTIIPNLCLNKKYRSGVYIIKNIMNGKAYIGSAIDCRKRIKDHIRTLNTNIHRNIYLQRAWNKQKEYFLFKVLLICDKNLTIFYEQKLIDEFKNDGLYNIDLVAGSSLGRKLSNKTKLKISKSKLGKHMSIEARKKMSESHLKAQYNRSKEHIDQITKLGIMGRGKKLSSETRKKISIARVGKPGHPHTEQFKKNLSKRNIGNQYSKGLKFTEEHKNKLRELKIGSKNPFYGRKQSKESIQKMLNTKKERGLIL